MEGLLVVSGLLRGFCEEFFGERGFECVVAAGEDLRV